MASRQRAKIEQYGLWWDDFTPQIQREMFCIEMGGRWQGPNGNWVGSGLFHHYKEFQKLTCPEKVWHRWNDLLLQRFCDHKVIGVIGPASSGKSREACDFARHVYYVFPYCTTIIISSTEKETLEDRIWGEIKRQHALARERFPWLPGTLIESRQRIVTAKRDIFSEDGRDFRNGIVGVPCKKGGSYVGLGAYSGRKNKIVILIADEGQFMPRAYVDAFSNLNKNEGFKGIVLGNPKDTTDALGVICEPASELGGWDGGIDQNPGTKTWNIRWPNGVCVQLPGSDSPNLDGKLGIPLITQEQMNADIQFYGKDSLQFTMMDEGKMPRGQGLKRVITRQKCLKFGAMEEVVWSDTAQTNIGSLDAAYGAVGGDRCIFNHQKFGKDVTGKNIFALVETMLVPVVFAEKEAGQVVSEPPEDQIAAWVKQQCEARGIPPGNFGFDSTGRGSLMNAFGRIWSTSVNGIEFGGTASDRPVLNASDVTCRDYYFNFVSELWYMVALTIECGQFRGMTEEVMLEGCMREWGYQGRRIQVEPKDKMKVKCFVAGTQILTSLGLRSIEQIQIGDEIVTPYGLTTVSAVHEDLVDEVSEVVFSNGSTLIGKGTHPVFTWNYGWASMDNLSLDCIVESVRDLWIWQLANGCFTKMTSIGFSQLVDIMHATATGKILARKGFYTGLSGKTTLGLFLKVGLFIIWTVIGKITARKISNWFVNLHTCLITWFKDGKTPLFGGMLSSAFQTGLRSQNFGIGLKWAGSGIKKTESEIGLIGHQLQKSALFAGNHFQHFGQEQDFVRSTATANSEKLTIAQIPGFAWSAAKHIWAIATNRHHIVPNRVQVRRCGKPEKVYNLTLQKHNAYYANGILVANCGRSPDLFDALVVGLEMARRHGFVIVRNTATTAWRDDKWKDDLRERADKLRKSFELQPV